MACPVCKSDHFYVKDPDDEFETYEFQVSKEGIDFQDAEQKSHASGLVEKGEIFCSRCSWHGLKKQID